MHLHGAHTEAAAAHLDPAAEDDRSPSRFAGWYPPEMPSPGEHTSLSPGLAVSAHAETSIFGTIQGLTQGRRGVTSR